MPTHVALLRAINVGGGGKVLMADLRRVVASLGHGDVATYIQTGNVIFSTTKPDAELLARGLEAAIAESLNVRSAVIVLHRDELATVVSRNPYPAEPDPRRVHAVFLPGDPEPAVLAGVEEAVKEAAARGSRDEAVLVGRILYLHTPDGFGRSGLATALLMRPKGHVAAGTARNWATVTKLLALCDG